MPALVEPHPNFWDMNSTDLFRTFWRLCINSSDWCANEKECKDSDGNRLKSSVKLRFGDEGPEVTAPEGVRGFERVSVREPDRGATDGAREEDSDEGIVGPPRCWGCCRMRLKPDAPIPCSCSVIMGDLIFTCQALSFVYYNRLRPSSQLPPYRTTIAPQ